MNFFCRSTIPNNGIQKIHLTGDDGQPSEAYFAVTHAVLSEICSKSFSPMEGDEIAVQLTLVRRKGSNGTTPS